MRKEIVIANTAGLHAQLAAKLVDVASKYDANVYMEYADRTVDAKSVLGLVSLAVPSGENVNLIAEGKEAEAAIQEIEKILE